MAAFSSLDTGWLHRSEGRIGQSHEPRCINQEVPYISHGLNSEVQIFLGIPGPLFIQTLRSIFMNRNKIAQYQETKRWFVWTTKETKETMKNKMLLLIESHHTSRNGHIHWYLGRHSSNQKHLLFSIWVVCRIIKMLCFPNVIFPQMRKFLSFPIWK